MGVILGGVKVGSMTYWRDWKVFFFITSTEKKWYSQNQSDRLNGYFHFLIILRSRFIFYSNRLVLFILWLTFSFVNLYFIKSQARQTISINPFCLINQHESIFLKVYYVQIHIFYANRIFP